jgi:hypothetical protein
MAGVVNPQVNAMMTGPAKKRKIFEVSTIDGSGPATTTDPPLKNKKVDVQRSQQHDPPAKATRERRLAQNRQAAKESRRRKKAMIEELQRSVVFFGKANAVLRNEHQELTRKLLNVHAELSKLGLPIPEQSNKANVNASLSTTTSKSDDFKPVVPTSSSSTSNPPASDGVLPSIETGATMQAMANFQQAAAVAMQSAAQAMQSKGVALEDEADPSKA